MTETLEFLEDLPADVPHGRQVKGSKYAERTAALRANPGKWVKFRSEQKATGARGFASSVNNGGLIDFQPKGEFRAECRHVGDGTLLDVYVRFVGSAAPTDAVAAAALPE